MNDNLPVRGTETSPLERLTGFCLHNRLVVFLVLLIALCWGLMTAPFDWNLKWLPRIYESRWFSPVAVDAIPDIGENQQILFTEWPGHSPQDIEDQISNPLTVQLLGLPGVRTVRSSSMFGFSIVYVIFHDDVDFYWSRSRVVEKLSSLPDGLLPSEVSPKLGPDATGLGQVFWYTLEGRDPDDQAAGGWGLDELRSVQDWYVRHGLQGVEGVSEVASIGGFVKEYQVDVDPDAMRAYDVKIEEVFQAVRQANAEVGARTIEVNSVEYVIRGIGFIRELDDLKNSVIKVNEENVPVYIRNVAKLSLGPALRRGALDKGGTEAVGGVVIVRYGANPLDVIRRVKEKIAEIEPGLPRKTLSDGTESQLRIIPFYDRTGLIHETLWTLNEALLLQIMVTVIVVLLMIRHLRSSLLISGLLPLAVLLCFIAMKAFAVDANIVALSGIVIAIGTMVDMGIVLSENILTHLDDADPDANRLEIIHAATMEVGGAVLTSVLTTVVSFLPVFTMIAAEGKLFRPLAFTKTFALLAAVFLSLTALPVLASLLFSVRFKALWLKRGLGTIGLLIGGWMIAFVGLWPGILLMLVGIYGLLSDLLSERIRILTLRFGIFSIAALVLVYLSRLWLPLGPTAGIVRNAVFACLLLGLFVLFFIAFQMVYPSVLGICLKHKFWFSLFPGFLLLFALCVWLGFPKLVSRLPENLRNSQISTRLGKLLPGLGKEFMPPLDEGSFLWMPTVMPHASIGEVMDVMRKQDMAFAAIPEVESAVGKLGRADTALDPAPVSMIETVINYKSEYLSDEQGKILTFRYDRENETFVRDEAGELIPDPAGHPYRQWREHIRNPDDIWQEIVQAGRIPGSTSAPKLQPIETRLVMLQSGMRAPMGLKITGSNLELIEELGLAIEKIFREQVPAIEPATVNADRIVGKPYLEIHVDRQAIARHGIRLAELQKVVEVAIGGHPVTMTVEGRERYPVRVRYLRELRDSIEGLEKILIPASGSEQIPLSQLAELRYVRGPMMIRAEDTFPVGYLTFAGRPGYAEVDVVESAAAVLDAHIADGKITVPEGTSFRFDGSYRNQLRAEKTLMLVIPLALLLIFLILYFQFRSVTTSALVFSGVAVAWAGGFVLLWLYGQEWFLDFHVFGVGLRQLFQVHPINLSVAVWVGFLALFGIATDDGVVMASYLEQRFKDGAGDSVAAIRTRVIEAGKRRVRPCLMTTATTLLALLPVLTSTGRGADIMVPMAIPVFGGMLFEVITMLVVPVFYCLAQELKLRIKAQS